MSFLDLVKKRRSCRKYSSQEIALDAIQKCLEAARLAPSACNCQPWHFIVVKDKSLKEKLAQAAFSGIHSVSAFAKEAPVLVVVVTEKSSYVTKLGAYLRGSQFSLIDVGIACEHFVLQAEEEDLGTCLIGWFNERAVKKVLNLPRNKKIDIIISLGYSREESPVTRKRKGI